MLGSGKRKTSKTKIKCLDVVLMHTPCNRIFGTKILAGLFVSWLDALSMLRGLGSIIVDTACPTACCILSYWEIWWASEEISLHVHWTRNLAEKGVLRVCQMVVISFTLALLCRVFLDIIRQITHQLWTDFCLWALLSVMWYECLCSACRCRTG